MPLNLMAGADHIRVIVPLQVVHIGGMFSFVSTIDVHTLHL